MTPMPPACAMAMAIRASVTVSIAADTSGMLRAISRVKRVRVSAVGGQDRGGRRHQQHVVEGQRLANLHPALSHVVRAAKSPCAGAPSDGSGGRDPVVACRGVQVGHFG